MKRKPGILSLVSARGQELRDSARTPLWWKAVAKKGPQALGWNTLRDQEDYHPNPIDGGDSDDEDGDPWRNKSFITISERDGGEASDDETDRKGDAPGCVRLDGSHSHASGHSHLIFGASRNRATMASWSGQPSVKGATETTRMILLTSASLGIA